MARYRGPKFKLSRREGVNITGTTSPRLEKVLQQPPGEGARGGRRRRRKGGDYSVRLRAKQRVRNEYGLLESQFRKTFERARKMAGPTGANLLQLLERRLDNVIYRLGYARTRPLARQLVSHGHVNVNNRRITIPSYEVKPGDVIELRASALKMPLVQEEMQTRGVTASWLERDTGTSRITGLPRRENAPADIREDLVVEFYSR
jgi:small subunit ribosomal protein S4